MAGELRVNGQMVTKPGHQVRPDAVVELIGTGLRYVSRGGLKLEQALDASGIDPQGTICLDVGASTGGFTDCLLQRGAAKVYAVDVGYGQLAWKLRTDERVVVIERENIRHLEADRVEDAIQIAVVDCSFIGLATVFPAMARFLRPGSLVVALIKPQFEVGRDQLGSHGVVRDAEARTAAIARVRSDLEAHGLVVDGGVDCRTHGPQGNVEYLVWGHFVGAPSAANEAASPSG
jgi:23S rRNA (cytidine1920-2'-O)/16S rRNA (cytidine1409-2'-O)-methyltransferase